MTYLDSNVTTPGWTLEDPTGINDSGQICGDGSSPQTQAFLLTPVRPGQVIVGDPVVDINDLTIVLANFGQTGCVWSQGCLDHDPTGTVDVNDLTIVLADFGKTYGASSGITAVPEPSCVVLFAIGLLAFAWRRWATP